MPPAVARLRLPRRGRSVERSRASRGVVFMAIAVRVRDRFALHADFLMGDRDGDCLRVSDDVLTQARSSGLSLLGADVPEGYSSLFFMSSGPDWNYRQSQTR